MATSYIPWARDTVYRKRPTFTEERGLKVAVWDDAEPEPIELCSVQPATTDGYAVAAGGARNDTMRRRKVFMQPYVDIKETDHIVFEGHEYEIEGEIQPWRSPSGTIDHLFLYMVEWEG